MNKDLVMLTGIHWAAVLLYVLATVGNTWGIIFKKEKAEKIASYLVVAGLLAHAAAILLWWRMVGHGPYMARYEVLSSMAWVMLALFLLFCRFFPAIRPASILVYPAAFLLIALGIFYSPAPRALPPTFKSIWLVLHVSFYKIALATIVTASALSLFFILKKRTTFEWLGRFPDLIAMDMLAYRFASFGFVFWSIAMLAGSIWAYQSWGRFWGWDPIETWSLITWAGFGLYLHLRRFFNWHGEWAAYAFFGCFLLSVVSLFFVPFLESSVHSEYFK